MEIKDIATRKDLASFLGIKYSTLTYVLYKAHVESFYKSFCIPKKNGSERHIYAPTGTLKLVQKRLANRLALYQKEIGGLNKVSHAFEKGKGIISNASVHRNKRYIICLDLENYFETFHFGRVAGYFEKNKNFELSHEVAIAIAQIACYNGFLPQGAPTSPVISNLIANSLDYHILEIAKKYRLNYTRYADDLTFSTNSKKILVNIESLMNELYETISLAGFEANKTKTRLVYYNSRQIVTGLVVNKKINVPKSFYKETRAMWHSYYKAGKYDIDGAEGGVKQLEGRFAFIDHLEHYNNRTFLRDVKHTTTALSAREREYRDFLFYTHFINNTKPVIITEGKTDVLYIKAALKSLYNEFPKLVERKENGAFEFKISFFNRTRHWEYFFGMSGNGADAMSRLYDYFSIEKPINLCDFFEKKDAVFSCIPVVLLYDNEVNNKVKPLKKFLDKLKFSEEEKEGFLEKCYALIEPKSKLYLATFPLIDGALEMETEDLFKKETLELVIQGRRFSRKDEDPKLFYNKNIFSKYIYKNYKTIDFSGFRPLLEKLSEICGNH